MIYLETSVKNRKIFMVLIYPIHVMYELREKNGCGRKDGGLFVYFHAISFSFSAISFMKLRFCVHHMQTITGMNEYIKPFDTCI